MIGIYRFLNCACCLPLVVFSSLSALLFSVGCGDDAKTAAADVGREEAGPDVGDEARCHRDEDCHGGVGYLCEDGRCVARCVLDEHCADRGAGWVCREGRCVPPGEPDGGGGHGEEDAGAPDTGPPPIICDPPCKENQYCHRGLCVDRCQAPLPCPQDIVVDMRDFAIDAYEASRPDASEGDTGCNSTRSCSCPARLPWTNVSWATASAACEASGKRLCSAVQWRWACGSGLGRRLPYGDTYDHAACNGSGAGMGRIWPGGSGERCTTEQGAFDLSGNVHEWIADELGPRQRGTLGGAFLNNMTQIACDYSITLESESSRDPLVGFRCCR